MNKLTTTFLLLFLSIFCFSQNETNNWYFGNKGGISFNNGTLNVKNDGEMEAPAGCSSISNSNGDLLFYTNGETIWNKNHQIMDNGNDLAGEIDNSQSSLIIPKPGDPNIYYVITTRKQRSSKLLITAGIYYSEVEFSSSNPLGRVTTKNRLLRNTASERVTAVHHANGNDIWLITFGNKNSLPSSPINTFMSYKIDNTGINTIPVVSEQEETTTSLGYMKASPNGKHIAIAEYQLFVYVYDFNSTTAEITYRKKVSSSPQIFVFGKNYGIEFSQDSKVLYFSCDGGGKSYVYQFFFLDTVISIKTRTLLVESAKYNFRALQLASNGRIYIAKTVNENNSIKPSQFLGEITFPETQGHDANLIENAIDLGGKKSNDGLPNFIQSYFRNRIDVQNGCVSDSFDFSVDSFLPVNSIAWDFGDGNTSNAINPNHTYNLPGKYISKAEVELSNLQKITLYKEVEVFSLPKLEINTSLIQCDVDNDGTDYFNLNNISSKIYLASDPIEYHFYENQTDAINDTQRINTPESYQNLSPTQTIYVRAINENGCYSIGSFEIISSFINVNDIQPIITCEDSDDIIGNNIGRFDLKQAETNIINQLNLTNIIGLSFYKTLIDAQTTNNKLDDSYDSDSSQIWLRIDNNLGCGGIKPVDLVVNSSLNIDLQDTYTICVNPTIHPPVILTGGSQNDKFEWKDSNNNILSTNSQFTLTKTGTFSLTIYKTENGIECSTSKEFTVENPTPPTVVNLDINFQDEQNNSIYISVDGNSSYEFSLDNINYFGSGTSHTFNQVTPGIGIVYVRDLKKCEPVISKDVSVIGYSNFFTPNGDNKNDTWIIYGLKSKFFKNIEVQIFNRFGKVLYSFNDQNAEHGWNGTFNGKPLPPNDYWFHAKLTDLKGNIIEKKGNFSLQKN